MASGAFGIQIAMDGVVQADAFFEGLDSDIQDFRPYFRELGKELRVYFIRQFAREGVGRAGTWKPLTKRYLDRKMVERPGRKILVYDGTLRRALVHRTDPHGLRVITKDQFVYGTQGLPYASAHQRGYPPHKLPKRPMIDFDDLFRKQLRDRMIWHVRKAAIRQRRRHLRVH